MYGVPRSIAKSWLKSPKMKSNIAKVSPFYYEVLNSQDLKSGQIINDELLQKDVDELWSKFDDSSYPNI